MNYVGLSIDEQVLVANIAILVWNIAIDYDYLDRIPYMSKNWLSVLNKRVE